MQTKKLSQPMYLSPIQRKKKHSRAKAVAAAWAILLNEDITVYHLVKKHSHDRYTNRVQPQEVTLFQ
jgi:hypothetical protein